MWNQRTIFFFNSASPKKKLGFLFITTREISRHVNPYENIPCIYVYVSEVYYPVHTWSFRAWAWRWQLIFDYSTSGARNSDGACRSAMIFFTESFFRTFCPPPVLHVHLLPKRFYHFLRDAIVFHRKSLCSPCGAYILLIYIVVCYYIL